MSKLRARIFTLCAVGALSSACAPTIKVAEIQRVKKLALIGYEANLKSKDGGGLKVSFSKDRETAQSNAILAYQQLGAALAKKMNWSVMSHADMTANSEYAAMYKEVQEGNALSRFQAKMSKLTENYYPEGVMWGTYAEALNAEQRDRLFKALDVDAVAMAQIHVSAKSSSTLLFSSKVEYAAQVIFKVYVPNSDEPIWSDLMANGEESDASQGWTFGPVTVRNDEQKAFLQAVERGYVALFDRYDEAFKDAQAKAKSEAAAPQN